MSQGAILWERVLARQKELEKVLDVFSDDGDNRANNESKPVADDILRQIADLKIEIDGGVTEPVTSGDPANPNIETADDGLESSVDVGQKVVDVHFEKSADLWLTRSDIEPKDAPLKDALRLVGLTSDVLPIKRPLLVFGSHRIGLTGPEYHRIEVERDGWPSRLYSTGRLTSTDAVKILASSETGTSSIPDSTCFEGKTVAVEVPNPLLARNRWIVLWPKLESLPVRAGEQWGQVRRVVWCVDRDKIGPWDLLDWFSRFWQDTPIRIVLLRSTSFVRKEKDEVAQSKVLPKVRRTLEKFDVIKGHPWIVVGP